jgi:hypothetical protein
MRADVFDFRYQRGLQEWGRPMAEGATYRQMQRKKVDTA